MTKRTMILFLLIASCLSLGGQVAWGATFGNAVGTTNDVGIEGAVVCGKFTLSEDGLATSMTAKINVSSAAKQARCLVFRQSDSSLVGYTERKSVAAGTAGEVVFNFYPPLRLFAGDYWLGAWMAAGPGFGQLFRDATGSGTVSQVANTFSNQTLPVLFGSYSTELLYIFCTYTPGTPAIFGDTTIGSSITTIEGTISGGTFIAPAYACKLDSCVAWFDVTDLAGTTAKEIKMAAYDSLTEALLDTTYRRSINIDDDMDGHRVFHFANPPTLTASQPVVLTAWCDTSSATFAVSYQGTGGITFSGVSSNFLDASGVYPDPLGATKGAAFRMNYFAYVTAVSAGGVGGRRRRILLEQSLWRDAQETFACPISDWTEK